MTNLETATANLQTATTAHAETYAKVQTARTRYANFPSDETCAAYCDAVAEHNRALAVIEAAEAAWVEANEAAGGDPEAAWDAELEAPAPAPEGLQRGLFAGYQPVALNGLNNSGRNDRIRYD